MFSALAEGHGNLSQKINLFVALCPITNLGWSTNQVIVQGANYYDYAVDLINSIGLYNIPNPGKLGQEASWSLCLVFPCRLLETLKVDLFGDGSPNDRADREAVVDKRNASDSSAK